MCDCIDELERRKKAPGRPPPRESPVKNWLPVLGGATLLALMAILYKSWGQMKTLVTSGEFCERVLNVKKPPKSSKICQCEE